MLRRVARVSRILMLLVGVSLLVWLPISFYVGVLFTSPWPPPGGGRIEIEYGCIEFGLDDDPGLLGERLYFDVWADERGEPYTPPGAAIVPTFRRVTVSSTHTSGSFPLWLLAVLCLAWPVTSFIVSRRRRRRRGFEVEPKPDSAVSTADC